MSPDESTDRVPVWSWSYLDGAGQVLGAPVAPVFTDRFDAESWLGAHVPQLLADGVAAAQLVHEGRVVSVSVELNP